MSDSRVTTVARHVVEASAVDEFRSWTKDIDLASARYGGYLGMEVIHSQSEKDLEFLCIFRFDTEGNLESWMHSADRARWLKDPRACRVDSFDIRSYRSLGFWFASRDNELVVPSDHKMALVTFAVIWPLVHVISPIASTAIESTLLAEFVSVGIIVFLMTYVVMPLITRFISNWLFR